MTFHITTDDIYAVCTPNAKTKGSAQRWTRGLPHERRRLGKGGGTEPARFRLADLVPALRNTRKGLSGDRLRALVECDGPFDVTVPVEGDPDALIASLTAAERERSFRIIYRFAKAMAQAFFDRYVHIDREAMLKKLILAGPVLHYALTGDRMALPASDAEWTQFSAAFVLANGDAETIAKLAD